MLRVLVEAGAALLKRSVGDPERALDGARRAALEAGQALLLVEAEVEEVLEAEAGGEQAALVGLADLADVADGGPELGRSDVELLDGLEQVAHDALDDLLQARVAAGLVEAGELVHQIGDRAGLEQMRRAWFLSLLAQIAAGDGQGYSGDVGGLVGGQEQDRARPVPRRCRIGA